MKSRSRNLIRFAILLSVLILMPFRAQAECKAHVVVEVANQRHTQDDALLSRLLQKAEHKAEQDGYCIDHLDLYDTLGNLNTDGSLGLRERLKDLPIAIFEVRSIPIQKNRIIIVSQMRWQRGYWTPATSAMIGHEVHVEDFEVHDFDGIEMDGGEPLGYQGYANGLENAGDSVKVFFKDAR